MTPSEYVGWAQRTAEELEVTFDGTPEDIETMIRNGQSERGDVFLDFGVSGNVMSRPGLSALTGTIRKDSNVSHVFIPRRNRLARPNDTMDAVTLENNLRRLGVTIVFMDKKCSPLKKGSRQDIADLITAAIDYDRSSEDRYELAQKVLYAQLRLAKSGYSTGGRPPYGFCRWLVKEDGTKVRELAEGEYVKMRGHHVVWLPSSEEHWAVIRRVLKMLDTMPASQVAKTLTYEKIPTPDHGRYRTDNGQRHATSGVWHQSTIINIARNPLLLAGVEYGRRSMGDQLRFTPDGPRQLEDTDFRAGGDESQAGDKPKVIRNPKETRIIAKASFEPLVDPKQHRRLLEKLDKRAGTQRGKPRSRDPNNNPQPYGTAFRYLCGLYQQSHGAQCNHNHVDGRTATEFLLSCIRQRVLSPQRLQKLENRIRQLAAADEQDNRLEQEIARKRTELAEIETQREQASQNLARAATDEQYQAIATIFDQLSEQAHSMHTEVVATESQLTTTGDADSAVDNAMEIVHQLTSLSCNGDNLGEARQIFELLNARLFLGFHAVKVKKRILNKPNGGVVTFGDAPPPVELYQGPTARKKIKGPTTSDAAGPDERCLPPPPESCVNSGREDKSLGNVSRCERI